MPILRDIPSNYRIRLFQTFYNPIHPTQVSRTLWDAAAGRNCRLFYPQTESDRHIIIALDGVVDSIGPCQVYDRIEKKLAEMKQRNDAITRGMETSKESPKNVRQD